MNWSNVECKKPAQGFNTTAQDANPGSPSQELEALPRATLDELSLVIEAVIATRMCSEVCGLTTMTPTTKDSVLGGVMEGLLWSRLISVQQVCPEWLPGSVLVRIVYFCGQDYVFIYSTHFGGCCQCVGVSRKSLFGFSVNALAWKKFAHVRGDIQTHMWLETYR